MSTFSTSEYKANKYVDKNITPGNNTVKINSIEIQKDKNDKNGKAVFIVLHVETAPVGGTFKGFNKDFNDPSKGTHEGQIGKVKTSLFAYRDGDINGTPITRDADVLRIISLLGIELGVKDKLDERTANAKSMEDLIVIANELFINGEYLNMVIGGKEYLNHKGFTKYDLFIAKVDRGRVSFENAKTAPSKLGTYDPTNKYHFKPKKKPEEADNFEPEDDLDVTP